MYAIKGILDQNTVPEYWKQRQTFYSTFNSKSSMRVIDLSNVTHCDSAGLAFLINLLKESNEANSTLSFINIPYQLQQLIKLSHLEDILKEGQGL